MKLILITVALLSVCACNRKTDNRIILSREETVIYFNKLIDCTFEPECPFTNGATIVVTMTPEEYGFFTNRFPTKW